MEVLETMNWEDATDRLLLQMEAQFVEFLNIPAEIPFDRSDLQAALDGTREELERRGLRDGGKAKP